MEALQSILERTVGKTEVSPTSWGNNDPHVCPQCGVRRFAQSKHNREGLLMLRVNVCKCNVASNDGWYVAEHEPSVDRDKLARQAARLSRWTGRTFDTWITRADTSDRLYPDLEAARTGCMEYARTFRERLEAGDGLYLWGPNGNGKSHLIEAMGRAIQDQGYIVVYLRQGVLFEALRATFGTPAGDAWIWDALAQADLVILDDLGVRNLSNWERIKVAELVDLRYPGRCLAITSNCSPDPAVAPGPDLCAVITPRFDDDTPCPPATYERIVELCGVQILHTTSPSYRGEVARARRAARRGDLS